MKINSQAHRRRRTRPRRRAPAAWAPPSRPAPPEDAQEQVSGAGADTRARGGPVVPPGHGELRRARLRERRHLGGRGDRPRRQDRRRPARPGLQARRHRGRRRGPGRPAGQPPYRPPRCSGRSTGRPASIDHASRTNCACVQASGVAEKRALAGREAGLPGGGCRSHTCSGSIQPVVRGARRCAPSRAVRRARGRPAASSYSPRSPAKIGHRRPIVALFAQPRSGSAGSRCPTGSPSGVSP